MLKAVIVALSLVFAANGAARADDGLVGSGQFGADADAGKPVSQTGFFDRSPLSGKVSVFDHNGQGGMRLKRTTIPTPPGVPADGDGLANSHRLPLGGLVEDASNKMQSLFPSLDNSTSTPPLKGGTQQNKPAVPVPEGHSIWQKSPLGGYYDASGRVRVVVKGTDLWRYGGTMADGMTPAPSGPCEQNSMGYIKWQPLHGGPPGWY